MKHGSLFSGIGGPDLAAEWMGWENVFHCEWNPFGQKVLKYYWPKAISYDDITKTDFTIHRGKIDILTGGFPCQPYSTAGLRKGKEDERHLWPEMLRAIREIKPRWVVGENVLGLVSWDGGLVFQEVQADLEAEGYEVQPYVLPAASVGAPHRRDRVWFVAYSKRNGDVSDSGRGRDLHDLKRHNQKEEPRRDNFTNGAVGIGIGNATYTDSIGRRFESQERSGERERSRNKFNWSNTEDKVGEEYNAANTSGVRSHRNDRKRENGEQCGQRRSALNQPYGNGREEFTTDSGRDGGQWDNFPTQPPVCSGNDGFSSELDGITFSKWRTESIKAGGNAIVPQVVHQIFKAIEEYERSIG